MLKFIFYLYIFLFYAIIYYINIDKQKEHILYIGGVLMTEKEMLKISIEEFSRLQRFMLLVSDKNSEAYKAMKERYIDLKAILTSSGVNVTEIDRIKE